MLNDETLRDGLQSPSVRCPTIEQKIEILHLIDRLGIDTADIGLPGAGSARRPRRRAAGARDCVAEAARSRPTAPPARSSPTSRRSSRSRSVRALPIECCTFIGSSPLRQYAEGWTLDQLLRLTEEAITFAVGEGLSVMYVTEDTTRADPETLRRLVLDGHPRRGRRASVSRTRSATPPRTARRPSCASSPSVVEECGGGVGIDWHGHRDRDFAVDQHAGGARRRSDAAARRRDRHRRARRQHADGHAAREPRADGIHRARSVGARRVLRGGVGGDRRADPAELSGRGPGRVPHGDRRARRGGHQGRHARTTASSLMPCIPACRRAWSAASRKSMSGRCPADRT